MASHPVSTEDLGPELPKCHLALPGPLGKGGQRVATGPCLKKSGSHTLLVSPDSLVLVSGREGGRGCPVCLSDAAFLPVCESVLPSPSVLA